MDGLDAAFDVAAKQNEAVQSLKDSSVQVPPSKREIVEEARDDYLEYTNFTFEGDYRTRWHHEYIADKLQKWTDPDSGFDRMMLFVPPRHGKSELASRHLPGWIFGNYPNSNIISASYNTDLAEKMSKDAKRVMKMPEYQWLFPKVQIPEKHVRADERYSKTNTIDEWDIVGGNGTYHATGAKKGISGVGADYLIIDDPFNLEMARSQKERDKVDEWWIKSLKPRLQGKDKVLIIMTRWNLDDLAARILGRSEDSENLPDWTVVRIPAISESEDVSVTYPTPDCDPRDEPGLALWPWRKSIEELLAIKEADESSFLSQYQNKPVPEGGNIIKLNSFEERWSEPMPVTAQWDIWWSMDPKGGSDDDSSAEAVIQCWGSPPHLIDAYWLAQVKGIWDYAEEKDWMNALWEGKHGAVWTMASLIVIENAGDGPNLKSDLGSTMPITTFEPRGKGSKTDRLRRAQDWCRAGNVIAPEDDYASWVRPSISQVINFPGTSRADVVDAFSQSLWEHFVKGENETSPAYCDDGTHYLEKYYG